MFSSKIWTRLAWLAFYLILAIILSKNSLGYLDPDFGWHLRVGENIAKTLSVPHDQIYMWSITGKNWVDHEWLSNLITYKLWQTGGYIAVSLFFIILPLIGFIILNRYVFKNYLRPAGKQLFFAAVELLSLIACLPHFGVRMQEFSFLLTIIFFIIVDTCRRKQTIKSALWLPPLFYLWACLHGGFLFGIAIILGWLIYEIILKIFPFIKNYFAEQILNNKNFIILIFIILISVLATLITPYNKELYSFLSDYGKNRYYLSHIEEWRTPYSLPFVYWQIIYTQIIVALFAITMFFTKKKFPLWKLVLTLALLGLASRSVRHFPLWAVGSLIFLVPYIILGNSENFKPAYNKLLNGLIIFCLFLVALTLGLQIKFINNPFGNYCQAYPCGAVQFLKANSQYGDLKMFNNYNWGGFLIGVWPEKKIFIDGRLPQYDFNNHTLLEEYNSFFDKAEIKNKLNSYDINLILYKTKTSSTKPDWFERLITGQKPQDIKDPLLDYLKSSPDWKSVYSDEIATVYVRK